MASATKKTSGERTRPRVLSNAPSRSSSPVKPSFVIVELPGGQFQCAVISGSLDAAYDLHAELKRRKLGIRAERGYTRAWLSVRGKALSNEIQFP